MALAHTLCGRCMRVLFLLIIIQLSCSCGTIVNMIEAPQPFGGIQRDGQTLGYLWSGRNLMGDPMTRGYGSQEALGYGAFIFYGTALLLVDFPLSFLADLLFLPLTWRGNDTAGRPLK